MIAAGTRSEDLYEIAQAILDPETGNFTDEVSESLEYAGSALLVMDRVTLDEAWRGHGLGAAPLGLVEQTVPAEVGDEAALGARSPVRQILTVRRRRLIAGRSCELRTDLDSAGDGVSGTSLFVVRGEGGDLAQGAIAAGGVGV